MIYSKSLSLYLQMWDLNFFILPEFQITYNIDSGKKNNLYVFAVVNLLFVKGKRKGELGKGIMIQDE